MGFKEALAFTLRDDVEGGWYDGSHPSDPNPTMKGVTQYTYDLFREGKHLPKRSVQQIEGWELEAIYRSYWEAVDGDSLPPKTAAGVFDMAVNAGPRTALKLLQAAVKVEQDGIIGPGTRAAIAQVPDDTLAFRFNTERNRHYVKLARRNPKLRAVLATWIDRVTLFADHFLTD